MSAFILAASQVFSQELSIQLYSPVYGGYYNIQCFGGRTGSIEVTVTGGTPPYTYRWTNDATTQNLSDLPAGYYGVSVTDYANSTVQGEITLTEPEALSISSNVLKYPNGYNVSCYDCYNGSITMNVSGGVVPYFYQWKDGPQTLNRSQLGAGTYELIVEDYNGCVSGSHGIYLNAPDRSDWTMTGNSSSNPATNFIGTIDQQDFVLKSNNSEMLRLKADGSVNIAALGSNNAGLLFIDNNGNLGSGNLLYGQNNPIPTASVPWVTHGNFIGSNWTPPSFLGTTNYYPLDIRTYNLTRMFIDPDGKVGIGTTTPHQNFEVDHSEEDGGIRINQASTTYKKSEIKFTLNDNKQWALGSNLENNASKYSFYIWNEYWNSTHPDQPPFYISRASNKVGIGTIPPSNNNNSYNLYVEGGIMTHEVKVTAGVFADYVFSPGYHLPSLKELSLYLDKHKHLPGIPSGAEVQKNEGFELGDMQTRLLEKIEELTLYILQQQKAIDDLTLKVQVLENHYK